MHKNNFSRKPLLVVRPSLVNALFPLFFKNFFGFGIVIFCIYFLLSFVNMFFDIFVPSVWFVFFAIVILTLLSISIKLFILRVSKYVFYDSSAIKDFKFIIVRRRSVVYSRITNITLRVSLWDRITRAGNITLHTGDDEVPDMILKYIKNPERIENMIYSLVHKKNDDVREVIRK
ncbi:MAG: PH domain-containing protein [Candidatus Woesearchaeota archaeon]